MREEKGQDMRLWRSVQPLTECLGEDDKICRGTEGKDKDGDRAVDLVFGGFRRLLPLGNCGRGCWEEELPGERRFRQYRPRGM